MKKVYGLFAIVMSLASAPLFAMASRPADPGTPPPPAWVQFVPFIVMLGVFYLLLIRPQMKQRKEKDRMMNELKKGDRVITQSGFIVTILSIGQNTMDVKLNDETKAKILKSAVGEIYNDSVEASKETAGTAS